MLRARPLVRNSAALCSRSVTSSCFCDLGPCHPEGDPACGRICNGAFYLFIFVLRYILHVYCLLVVWHSSMH